MKQRIAIFFTLLFISIITSQCTKDLPFGTSPPEPLPPETLPPITQIGANTFGCKINGHVWVPYYPCDLGQALELEYNIGPIYPSPDIFPLGFWISAVKSEDPYSGTFTITYAHLRSDTTASYIYGTGNVADSIAVDFFTDTAGYYRSNPNDPNRIFQITKLDTVNKIISGTFSFTLYESYSDSVVVTDGRFDLRIGVYSRCSH